MDVLQRLEHRMVQYRFHRIIPITMGIILVLYPIQLINHKIKDVYLLKVLKEV